MKIHIKNGRLIDPKNNIDAQQDVFIAAGKIAGIGKAPEGFVANQTIDANRLPWLSGFICAIARARF
jgi:dihydroorotase